VKTLFRNADDRSHHVEPESYLADADLFFFYLRGGTLAAQSEAVVKDATAGKIRLRVSSEIYDDVVSALRADENPLDVARDFVADMKAIPHTSLPMSAEVAEDALSLYIEFGGRRRLSYFDSLHVATARRFNLPMLTSDGWIAQNQSRLRVAVTELATWTPSVGSSDAS
jgi:predicted nucleic acid-binding protein